MNAHTVADMVALISGLMTIFGVNGFLSWSFCFQHGSFAENSISALVCSFKTAACLLVLWPASTPFIFVRQLVVLSLTRSGSVGAPWWDANHPFACLVSYMVSSALVGPFYIICCACIYVGSIRPLKSFLRQF